jgi:hypothetical protein
VYFQKYGYARSLANIGIYEHAFNPPPLTKITLVPPSPSIFNFFDVRPPNAEQSCTNEINEFHKTMSAFIRIMKVKIEDVLQTVVNIYVQSLQIITLCSLQTCLPHALHVE